MENRNVNELVGKTLTEVKQNGDKLIFVTNEGKAYKLYHYQDCCESVTIEDIIGDLNDLVGSPILLAEEVYNYKPVSDGDIKKTNESNDYGGCTWTFYKFATIKGYVDVRWFGESNGYYSESVDFVLVGTE